MKLTHRKWIISVTIFIIVCNIFRSYFIIFIEGHLYDYRQYITKDRRFPSGLLYVRKDTISQTYYCYMAYRKAYPEADTTLYRINPLLLYRFWRWGEYLIDPHWRQPYIEMSYKEWDGIFNQMWANKKKYGTPFPKDTVNVPKQ